ncbi:EpsG family protein [Clostridium estertheticum]|uniref:EpsG family protein n=1 Tax=Clostridium estertheticum TaxID=238834 RepID=UPI001C0BCEF0|nr:EpsG family protein [Clostridium estertheticum]MBU3197731.1 EpsG family protein [Clostridium estertheticum]WAG65533.1 EpsG family protein [Clostridium estertheticum]
MIYFYIFIVILILAILELSTKLNMKKLFNVIFILLTLMSSLRYGVGSDFFNYMYIYSGIPKLNNPYFKTVVAHTEYGYNVIQGFFKMFNLDYSVFVFVITAITMLLFYLYIKKNSRHYMVSLLIFYSMYYFTYINSGIRQGLAIGLFLVVLLPMLQKKEYLKYVLFTLLFSLIHSSIVIVLVLPLIYFNVNKENFIMMILCASIISFANIGFLLKPFGRIYTSYQYYLGAQINIFPIISRVVIFSIIVILYKSVSNKIKIEDKNIMKYYIVGIIIYITFCRSELLSSRLNVYFKCFEIILIPNLIQIIHHKQKKLLISYVICIIMMTMWTKEINAALEQGEYYNKGNVLNYPYVSVFNKNDISLYRPIYYKIDELDNMN